MMKSRSIFTGLLMAGSMVIFLTAGVNGQELDLTASSRRTVTQDEPKANEPGSLSLVDDDSSPSDLPADDTELMNDDQSEADDFNENEENEPDENEADDDTLNGEFSGNGWPRRSIQNIQIALTQQGRTPEDRSASIHSFGRSGGLPTSSKLFAWAAPNIRYQPLYFEDVALERYGQTAPLHKQAVKSAIHFSKSFVLLSHQMLHDHPHNCDSPLGFCRPGTCVPRTVQRQYFGSVLAK